MPKVDFGEKTHFDGKRTEFIELKHKDEKVHVRFLGSAIYDGKHFLKQPDGKWNVTYCPRIMADKECSYCEKAFEARKAMKAMRDELGKPEDMQVKDKATYKGLEQTANHFGETKSFYYPVLNRETQKAGILKCTQSIRWKLDEEHSNDIPILDFDYIVKRTEKPGSDYYTLTRLDSAMIKPFTDEENEEVDIALGWDMEAMVYGKKSSFDLAQEEDEEIEEPEEEVSEPEEEIDIDELIEDMDGQLPGEENEDDLDS